MIDDGQGWCWSCRFRRIITDDVPDGSRTLALSYDDCLHPNVKDDDQDSGERGLCKKWEDKHNG